MLEMYAGSRVTPPIVDGADLAVFCGYITLDFFASVCHDQVTTH